MCASMIGESTALTLPTSSSVIVIVLRATYPVIAPSLSRWFELSVTPDALRLAGSTPCAVEASGVVEAGAPAPVAGFRQRVFYSDSSSDLPLLEWVDAPTVVRPDASLRAHAEARGWPIIERLV